VSIAAFENSSKIRYSALIDKRKKRKEFVNIFFFQIFSKVKEQQPNVMEKITAVTGDVTLPQLGLSPSDLQLLTENVSVVFHSAATVRFDEELKTALVMNVKGPMELLEICRKMKHLEVVNFLLIFMIVFTYS
jgi:fatty acyl-CoA reductase